MANKVCSINPQAQDPVMTMEHLKFYYLKLPETVIRRIQINGN